LPARIRAIAAVHEHCVTTKREAFLDVERLTQRKEMVLMMALKQMRKDKKGNLRCPAGNQTDTDCTLVDAAGNRVPTQVKTVVDVATGQIPTHHRYKGHAGEPYRHDAGFDQVVGGVIVKSGADYWLLHYILPKWKLLEEGVLVNDKHENGNQKVSIPWPDALQQWLLDKKKWRKYAIKEDDWRLKPAFTWREPFKLKMKNGLTSKLINGIKPHPAADPSKAPDKASASASASDAPVRITGAKRKASVN